MASAKVEVYENRVMLALSRADDATFLEGLEDVSRYVTGDGEVQVIHRSYLGVKPDVLINNTTYPIDVQALNDADVPITLDKFQTKQTIVSDDDLYASAYDKIDAVTKTHRTAIEESKYDKAIHALAPASHTTNTPVIVTTGDDDGTGRRKLLKVDIIKFRRSLGKNYKKGMRLVLCSDHINDILEWQENYNLQYADNKTGLIMNKYGFEIYEYANNPYYVVSTKAKLSFGGTPVAGTHTEASVCFYPPRCVKAIGKLKMYYSKAENNPATQANAMNFRHYAIAMPTENMRIGAIISGIAS